MASILEVNSGLIDCPATSTKFGVNNSEDCSMTGNVIVMNLGPLPILNDWLIFKGVILGKYPVSITKRVSASLLFCLFLIFLSKFAKLDLKKSTDGRSSIANL